MTSGPGDEILQALARSNGRMADAATEMSYDEIAAAVAQVADILQARRIAATDCLAFACANDLGSAIVLLALLATGRTFLLLPRAAASTGHCGQDMAPVFCRHHLRTGGQAEAADAIVLALANTSIVITENRRWRAGLTVSPARVLVPTSGSTATPKLVQHRHDRLRHAAGRCADRLGLAPADRIALPVPIAHMFGLGAAFMPAVLAGASVDLQSDANVLRYLARERHFDPTIAFLTPGFGEAMTRVRRNRRAYRLTVMAGDRLPADLFDRYERLHGCLVNLYGSTELGVIAAGDPADPAARRRNVIGRPMPGVAIGTALDRASDAANPGAAQILRVLHACGFEHYVGADGQTAREPDGSLASGDDFCTSDVGQLIDGYVAVHGRSDDLVNRDGLLVACGDVAAALRAIPGIADAAVLSGGMSRRGLALIACCVHSAGPAPKAASVRQACLEVLPARAVPDAILFLPELPRLPGGKIDRTALRRHHVPEEVLADAHLR